MDSLKMTGALLGALGFVALVLVQFLPWGGLSAGSDGFSADSDAYTWQRRDSGSFGGFSGSDTTGWYSSEASEDEDGDTVEGVTQVRIGIPFLLAGLVLATVGVLVALLQRGAAGAMFLVVAGLAAGIGTVLFAMGVAQVYDGEQEWAASFFLAIAGSALALLGGVLGLVAGNRHAAG